MHGWNHLHFFGSQRPDPRLIHISRGTFEQDSGRCRFHPWGSLHVPVVFALSQGRGEGEGAHAAQPLDRVTELLPRHFLGSEYKPKVVGH